MKDHASLSDALLVEFFATANIRNAVSSRVNVLEREKASKQLNQTFAGSMIKKNHSNCF